MESFSEKLSRFVCRFRGHVEPEVITGFRSRDGAFQGLCPRCGESVACESVKFSVGLMEKYRILECVDLLRLEEGDCVTILCDNPDFGAPANAIVCSGEWTLWQDRRFEGDSLLVALECALKAANRSS